MESQPPFKRIRTESVSLENPGIDINASIEDENSKEIFKLLFQPREFIKNSQDILNFTESENRISSQKDSQLLKDHKIFSQEKLISEVENQKYVIIADSAGNGKSWISKHTVDKFQI